MQSATLRINPMFLFVTVMLLGSCGGGDSEPAETSTQLSASDQILQQAYLDGTSDLQVEGEGTVTRRLADDNDGSRHQRFILQLASTQTLLVAHNIDLAPRINTLAVGDRVAFYGEYEWGEQGGVIHWTHHDPAGVHVDGWLKHEGVTYQ